MKPIAVTAKLSVAPQPLLSDFQELRRLGFMAIVNNRPDGEDRTSPARRPKRRPRAPLGSAMSTFP